MDNRQTTMILSARIQTSKRTNVDAGTKKQSFRRQTLTTRGTAEQVNVPRNRSRAPIQAKQTQSQANNAHVKAVNRNSIDQRITFSDEQKIPFLKPRKSATQAASQDAFARELR
jgi:hypothetical protein